jgi:hypothetical protein
MWFTERIDVDNPEFLYTARPSHPSSGECTPRTIATAWRSPWHRPLCGAPPPTSASPRSNRLRPMPRPRHLHLRHRDQQHQLQDFGKRYIISNYFNIIQFVVYPYGEEFLPRPPL